MKLMILLTDRCLGSLPVSLIDALITVNYCHIKAAGRAPLFEWKTVSVDGQPVLPFNGVPLPADCSLAEALADRSAPVSDQLWVVPSVYDAISSQTKIEAVLEQLSPMVDGVAEHYRRGGLVGSCCTGSFLLARAGLFSHSPALMHWRSEANFRQLFPGVRTDTRSVLADYGRIICTTGGAQTAHHLVLHLAERYGSRQLALTSARMMLVDPTPTPPPVYSVTDDVQAHADDLVRAAMTRLRESLHQTVSLEQMAAELSISTRQLVRRFQQATGLSPLKFLQKERLKRACQYLESSQLTSARVALEVGYQDESHFRRLFKRELGMTMEQYRAQFGPLREAQP
ncbi:helix-turn-helix domain-containing protein [Natronospirillum operosum]|uniref:Helix-turn-helix domain-containing protein n=1 Tax=Natronospirillum operosum TaxID=2759953 RepID=A0A4Z0W2I7_9GAMM|nr:helix-turn-helix domain-containing protein [Natronospirillum operosum]TGG90616.1 helix-turn-helix domain-containing protein [Natronospirillum operosum]